MVWAEWEKREQKHLAAININDMDLTMCYTNGGESPPHIWQLENKTTEGKCIQRSDMEDTRPEGRERERERARKGETIPAARPGLVQNTKQQRALEWKTANATKEGKISKHIIGRPRGEKNANKKWETPRLFPTKWKVSFNIIVLVFAKRRDFSPFFIFHLHQALRQAPVMANVRSASL